MALGLLKGLLEHRNDFSLSSADKGIVILVTCTVDAHAVAHPERAHTSLNKSPMSYCLKHNATHCVYSVTLKNTGRPGYEAKPHAQYSRCQLLWKPPTAIAPDQGWM